MPRDESNRLRYRGGWLIGEVDKAAALALALLGGFGCEEREGEDSCKA